jgi:spermidine synthase
VALMMAAPHMAWRLPCYVCVVLHTGGEGATAREVLRHTTVEKVVMVDIDKVRLLCVRACVCALKQLPHCSSRV